MNSFGDKAKEESIVIDPKKVNVVIRDDEIIVTAKKTVVVWDGVSEFFFPSGPIIEHYSGFCRQETNWNMIKSNNSDKMNEREEKCKEVLKTYVDKEYYPEINASYRIFKPNALIVLLPKSNPNQLLTDNSQENDTRQHPPGTIFIDTNPKDPIDL